VFVVYSIFFVVVISQTDVFSQIRIPLPSQFSHLTDALIQRDLQEQLGLSGLLKATSSDFAPSQLGIRTSDLLVTDPTARLPAYMIITVMLIYVLYPMLLYNPCCCV
jgi:hypothetical protein